MKINYAKMTMVALPIAALVAFTAPALAATGTAGSSVGLGVKLTATDTKLRDTSTAEIGKRISDLTTLAARLGAMVHVSDSTKISLNASMQGTITALTNLKNKIDGDADVATLKADVASITKGYRVYLLVAPQMRILATADRATTIGAMMTALDAKFQTRITAATAAGRDTTAILAAEADMKAKIADANLQASTAISTVSGLLPDNGDAAILASNTAALTKARADVRVGTSDLVAAGKDIKTIISALKGFNLDTSTTATAQQ